MPITSKLYLIKYQYRDIEEENIMGTLAIIIMYAVIISVISAVSYFVIKSAVKAALKEFEEEKRYEKN